MFIIFYFLCIPSNNSDQWKWEMPWKATISSYLYWGTNIYIQTTNLIGHHDYSGNYYNVAGNVTEVRKINPYMLGAYSLLLKNSYSIIIISLLYRGFKECTYQSPSRVTPLLRHQKQMWHVKCKLQCDTEQSQSNSSF